MSYELNVSTVASLLAEPARSAMLAALLDGRALPAGELASASGVNPQTASTHLAKLLDGNLITVARQGRHRYYRLVGADDDLAVQMISRRYIHGSSKASLAKQGPRPDIAAP